MSGPGKPLPAGWRLQWLGKGERPAPAALGVDLATVADHGDAVSTAFWRHGLAPWGKSDFPLGDVQIALGSFPALDEVWTLFLWSRREAGEDLPASWEAICRYASDVRQGLWPDRVRPEHSPQAVYLTLAQELLLGSRPDRTRFIEEAFALCAHLGGRLSEGARLLDDDLLAGVPAFERYTSMLVKDRDLYQEDLGRSRRFWAEIPGAHSPTGTPRRLPLLILEQPVARQFKLWARSDPGAPGGAGFPLLFTRLPNQAMVLSADPSQRVTVGWLAAGLSEREKAARAGEDAAWYDGKNHAGTLVAAPLDGTKLPFDDVLQHLKAELRLKPISSGTKIHAARTAAIALASALAVLGGIFVVQKANNGGSSGASPATPAAAAPEKAPGPPEEAPTGAKGDPLDKEEVVSLIDSNDGPRSMENFALVAGVCSYEGDQKLHAPCRDARAMRDMLIKEYGYQKDKIIFLVDKPEGGERVDGAPTAENMKSAVEKFRSRFGDNENSTFLFYYSGHGGYIKGAQADFGVLQPTGFFSTLKDQPYQHRGWDMQRLIDDIKKGVPSRHIMLVLDACYSGWAGAKGDDELDTRVRSLWKEQAEVVLSAGSKGQRAWEDEVEPRAWVWGGHSAMTAFVLEGLQRGAEGLAQADTNKDRVVTDEELAAFVREKVPASVHQFKNKSSQTPSFFRLDQGRVKSGQFLFVPAKRDGTP